MGRADPARARTSGGTGLGLAISLEDALLHGGWLEAWGRPGMGASFRLTLPRRAGIVLVASPLDLVPARAAEEAVGHAIRHDEIGPSSLPVIDDVAPGQGAPGPDAVPGNHETQVEVR